MSTISRDGEKESNGNLVIEDELYKMAESQLNVIIEKEREEIVSDTPFHRSRTFSSINAPSFSERLRNTLRQWSFATGSAVGVAATIAAVLVLPPMSPAPVVPGTLEGPGSPVFPVAEVTRGVTGESKATEADGSIRVVRLAVKNPLESALVDAKKLLDDGVKVSSVNRDENSDDVSVLVPVTTESEVYFLETYQTEIGQEGFSLLSEAKTAKVVYRQK